MLGFNSPSIIIKENYMAKYYGFVKVASCSFPIALGDIKKNRDEIINNIIKQWNRKLKF